MMTINDARNKDIKVNFADLPIGQVYEDKEGYICIKTGRDDIEENCIYYICNAWETHTEGATTKVTPLKTTLMIER